MLKKNIVKKAKSGDTKAFQELIDREKIKLFKIAYLYSKNEDDALDIFQETLYKALSSIQNLKEDKYFSTWITRILINNAKDFLRKKNRSIPMELEYLKTNESSPSENIEDRMDLLKAIDYLDEKEKSALILRYYRDYSVNQIAVVLDIPEGSVKSTIHRALKKLKVKVGGIVNG
ncbi:sigma-70 family RNA polymerase sigma factor [Bacillus sp. OV166]|uniref:sigma-70 family RNA polymerase sigma factor n=1 Tax=Bacillus sp. OV166 TaxID=1882763 RepID=UPI00211B4B54|nr:sigma-70 family RNA polymerase sigma factor [Bacillus sp. OV166]